MKRTLALLTCFCTILTQFSSLPAAAQRTNKIRRQGNYTFTKGSAIDLDTGKAGLGKGADLMLKKVGRGRYKVTPINGARWHKTHRNRKFIITNQKRYSLINLKRIAPKPHLERYSVSFSTFENKQPPPPNPVLRTPRRPIRPIIQCVNNVPQAFQAIRTGRKDGTNFYIKGGQNTGGGPIFGLGKSHTQGVTRIKDGLVVYSHTKVVR